MDKDIPYIIFGNWTAPALMHASVQEASVQILTWGLHDNLNSVGVALGPVFTYNKGKLHLEEAKLLESLAGGQHNLDWQFSVVFGQKCDQRDLRPMVYPGRFVFSSAVTDLQKNIFFHCNLRKDQRTPEISQLAGKQMKEVIDMAADALPHCTDLKDYIVE